MNSSMMPSAPQPAAMALAARSPGLSSDCQVEPAQLPGLVWTRQTTAAPPEVTANSAMRPSAFAAAATWTSPISPWLSNSAQSVRSGEPGATCVLWNRGPTGPSGTPRSNMLVANTSSRPSALRAAAIDVNWPGSCAQADQLLPADVCERWNGAPARLTPNSSTRPSALVSTQTHRSAPSRMDQATD